MSTDYPSSGYDQDDQCSLLLRFFGESLDPDAITALLGVEPTSAARKGDSRITSFTESQRGVAQTGMWLLDCEVTDDELDNQIQLLFGDLSDDLAIWNELANTYLAELKCHLFLKRWNSGTILSPDTLAAIAARRLRLILDIYAPRKPNAADA